MTVLNPINRKLFIWVNQMLYLGISPVPYREHAIVSDKLIISLKGAMEITLDNGDKITSRTCLLQAGINFEKANIDTNNAVMAIYFIAPITQDYCALESIMSYARNGVHYDHPEEDFLIDSLLEIRNTSIKPEEAFTMLRKLIVQPHLENHQFREFDERIIEVIKQIKITVSENISLKKFAEDVYLSESRLEKLFKDQIGIPITKYRLKYRVYIGIIHLALGQSITNAALAAGFASSSHFSKSFRAINGIPPSATFLKPPYLHILLADEVLKKIYLSDKKISDNKNKTPKRIQLGEYDEYIITNKD
ncbi:MAG: AraC-like DNA-binding protein [Oleispira sp.]|jgi:AraC-like DNA-binding protein